MLRKSFVLVIIRFRVLARTQAAGCCTLFTPHGMGFLFFFIRFHVYNRIYT
jgi:hypothetical protein